MEIIIRTGFKKVDFKINFSKGALSKGKELVQAKNVKYVEELNGIGDDKIIKCEVLKTCSSNDTWKVNLEVSNNSHCKFYFK